MWEAMKPLPPVRRTVGFENEPVMITGFLARKFWSGPAGMSRNELNKMGGHDGGMLVPHSRMTKRAAYPLTVAANDWSGGWALQISSQELWR